jgi:hypothetical protein
MIIERKGSLTVLPKWDDKKMRRSRHFCGRAHASRFVERWIANPGAALIPDVAAEAESNRVTSFGGSDERGLDEERAEERKIEQMLMLDVDGEVMSSARIVPAPAALAVSAGLLQAVAVPPPCALPPSLANVMRPAYARQERMMS